ncbi:hypothetical protein FB473_001764 [Brooklawnia cerclae]|uniref:Uncharacterized protein n=1 Tax=Brooklawnia cerclae TaxID=349934 RepID=A0ABX0SGU1_9ACTN|nr:hypothetical protein [Brooklawnia cerclae]
MGAAQGMRARRGQHTGQQDTATRGAVTIGVLFVTMAPQTTTRMPHRQAHRTSGSDRGAPEASRHEARPYWAEV